MWISQEILRKASRSNNICRMIIPHNKYSLKPIWWFWLPVSVILFVTLADPFLDRDTHPLMYAENGFLESLQWVIALTAAGFGFSCLRYCRKNPPLFLWVLLGTLGSLYIGLEEISYGQHLLKWETPAYWEALNDQGETNLHNTSSWFDQKPRLVLLIGVLCGGIALPLVRRFKPSLLPQKFNIIYPSDALFCTAALTAFAHSANWLKKADIISLYGRPSEVTEICMYYFVMLYLVMLRQKFLAQKPAG